MSAKDNLSVQFEYSDKTMQGESFHTVYAFNIPKNEDHIGLLEWSPNTGEILNLYVQPQYRRRGVATGMYNYAQNVGVTKPIHSRTRTASGDAWARSVGGDVPENYNQFFNDY